MSDEWQLVRVEDLAEVFDGPHATPTKTEHGPWYLSISSLKNGKVDLSESAHLSGDDFPTWTRRVQPEPGDTLFSYETRLGEAGHWSSDDQAALGRRMGLLRPRRDRVDPRFLTYAYIGPQFQAEIRRRSIHGATVDRIPIAEIGQWPIALPPLDEQRRIADVLGALDDLIDTNRRLARQLDSRLIASWLALARRCHTERVLGEFVDLRKGVSYKGTFLAEHGLPLINLANFALDGSFKEPGTKHYIGPVKDRQLLSKGSLVVANTDLTQRCDILARPLLVPFQAATSTHHTFQVDVRGSDALRGWIFCALRTDVIRRRLISFATGTTVAALPADALLSQKIPLASDQVIEGWWSKVSALREAQESVAMEARELVHARGEFLPLLMSGQVRIKDVAA